MDSFPTYRETVQFPVGFVIPIYLEINVTLSKSKAPQIPFDEIRVVVARIGLDFPVSRIEMDLIRQYAEAAATLVIRKAISYLRASKHTLSGDDSGLKTTWDEICVQVQEERSYFWDAYIAAMRDAISSGLFDVENRDKQCIWLQTEAGWHWIWDVENGRLTDEEMPVDENDLINFLVKRLEAEAGTYTNSRIKEFLKPQYD